MVHVLHISHLSFSAVDGPILGYVNIFLYAFLPAISPDCVFFYRNLTGFSNPYPNPNYPSHKPSLLYHNAYKVTGTWGRTGATLTVKAGEGGPAVGQEKGKTGLVNS